MEFSATTPASPGTTETDGSAGGENTSLTGATAACRSLARGGSRIPIPGVNPDEGDPSD
jgi:hypothetical protein